MSRGRLILWLLVVSAILGLAFTGQQLGLISLPGLPPRVQRPAAPPSPDWAEQACQRGTGAVVLLDGVDDRPDWSRNLAPRDGGIWELTTHDGVLSVLGKQKGASTPAIHLQFKYDPARPVREYLAGRPGWIGMSGDGWNGCELAFGGRYSITGFPQPDGSGDAFRVQFRVFCATENVIGCIRVAGQPVVPWTPPPPTAPAAASAPPQPTPSQPEEAAAVAEPAPASATEEEDSPTPEQTRGEREDSAGATTAAGEAGRPLDELGPCPPWEVRFESSERSDAPASAVEYLGAYRASRQLGVTQSSQLPSALDATDLARKHFRLFSLDGTIPADVRRALAKAKREEERCEAICGPPPSAAFEVPAREVPGHFYLFGPAGPAEVKPTGVDGLVLFRVDVNGCEQGDRYACASVKLASGDGILFWSPQPTELGGVRRLALGQALAVEKRALDVGHGWSVENALVLTSGGRRVVGPAAGSRVQGAYLVTFGGKPHLLADYRSSPEEICSELVLYSVGERLTPVGTLDASCGGDGSNCLPCLDP